MSTFTPEDYRKSGNCCYEKFKEVNRSEDKLAHLIKALEFYNQAILCSSQDSIDFKFANKNAFLCYFNLCQIEDEDSRLQLNFIEGARCLSYALVSHFNSIDRKENFDLWAQNLFHVMKEFVELFVEYVSALSCSEAQELLYKFTSVMRYIKRISSTTQFSKFRKNFDEIYQDYYLRQIEILHNYAVSEISDKNFTKANELIRLLYPLINECKSYNPPETKIQEHIESITELDTKGKALKCYHLGLKNLNTALNYEETMNMDYVWAALDDFRESIVEIKGESVEILCMAKTKIGIIYYELLKGMNNEKCEKFFEEVIELGNTLERNYQESDWYKEAQDYRARIISAKPLEKETVPNKEEIKKKLKEKLDKLETFDKDLPDKHTAFCLKIFKEFPHPAPDKSHKKPIEDSTDKRNLRNTLAIYHTDKNPIEKHGPENFVLCEEISKLLNKRLTKVSKSNSSD